MSFLIYDLTLLAIFVIFISVFLYSRRKNLQKEGLLLLYRTEWGIKLINYVGKKYKRTLKILSYISIATGYLLMFGMFYLAYTIIKIYIFLPEVVKTIKVPPIMPLIPYFPSLFNLESFLPPFNFTYWIVILAVIAISHEFAHGIFAAYDKIKIKSTGFGFFPFFLPVFLAAFVELDEPKMFKKSKVSQMAILSSGTFANMLVAGFFFIVLWLFFSFSFVPSGVVFNDYAYSIVNVKDINMINGVSLENPSLDEVLGLTTNDSNNEIFVEGEKYVAIKGIIKGREDIIALYNDAPAIKKGLKGAIIEINEIKINSIDKLEDELGKYSPRQEIAVKTKTNSEIFENIIKLEEHPEKKNLPWLGIGFSNQQRRGFLGKVYSFLGSFKKPHVYYKSKFGAGEFIYNLLWWLILISISVALINMLPVGIFDGGRFFYLTVLWITGSESKAKKTFKASTYFFLFLLLLIMMFWIISFIK
ncbi:MAG: site-2 protease family protein [Candidatus Nanoarchaeia archaeon]